MRSQTPSSVVERGSSRAARRPGRKTAPSSRPRLEMLEDRIVLSNITWNSTTAPNGGDWDTASDWIGGVLPGVADNAIINLTNGTITHNTIATDSVLSITTNAGTTLTLNNGSMTIGNGISTLNSAFTVSGSGSLILSGATLTGSGSLTVTGHLTTASNAVLGLGSITLNSGSSFTAGALTVPLATTVNVGTNSTVQIQGGQTITDNGTINFSTGDTVTFGTAFNQTTPFLINGSLTSTGMTFNSAGPNGNSTTLLQVNPGGHLTSTNSTFALNQLVYQSGSSLSNGDLSNNGFDTTVFVPASDVAFLSTNRRFQDIDIVSGTLATGQTLALNAIGTDTSANLRYVFPGAFIIASGAIMNVAGNVNVFIPGGQIFTDNGSVSFGAGDMVTFGTAFNQATQFLVNQTFSATGTTFVANAPNGNSSTLIQVNAGGTLSATGSTFALSQVIWANGSTPASGTLTTNGFDESITVPISGIAALTANRRFQDIDILGATLSGNQNVALNAIGTDTVANLRYVFTASLTVAAGSDVAVAPTVRVLFTGGQTFTDNGSIDFAAGDTVTFGTAFNQVTQLLVNGTLDAFGTTVNAAGPNGNSSTLIQTNAGGHFYGSNNTFALTQLSLLTGSVLSSGELTGNGFDLAIFVPAVDMPLLASNRRFQDVNILAGTLQNGQSLALNAIGTDTTVNLRYVFPGGFTVAAGATVTVAPTVNVLISGAQTFTENGNMTFGIGDTLTFGTAFNQTTQLQIGGTLATTGTTINAASPNGNSTTFIQVNSGGHLTASNSTFALTSLTLAAGSVLNAGDLVGDGFDLPIYVPALDIPLLASNRRFQNVNILAGSLVGGQTLALNLIGTDTSVNLVYVFAAAFSVNSGATLNVAPNTRVMIFGGQTLTDAGAINLTAGDMFTLGTAFNQVTTLAVSGTLAAAGGTINSSPANGNSVTTIAVNSGGNLNVTSSSFSLNSLALNVGSVTTLHADAITGQFAINSAATITVTGNDFSNIGASSVIASGDPNATIILINNYWGTTNPVQIAAKIKDHTTDATRPTISYQPFIGAVAATTAASASATYNLTAQTVALSAAVTSTTGAVNEGTETFTILNGAAVVGSPVTVNVLNSLASANYTLPAGTAAGQYVIQATYSGTGNFVGSTDSSHLLTINPAATTTVTSNLATTFNLAASQSIGMNATVTSAAGAVNEGILTFTLLNGATIVGAPVTVNVMSGSGSINYTLPAGASAGVYTIQAVYTDPSNFQASADTGHHLNVNPASTSTASTNVSAFFAPVTQTVVLTASVSSAAGTVGEGSETFTILNGATVIGFPISASVLGGIATANYVLPAATTVGPYTIKAVYNGSNNFVAATDLTHVLTINTITTTTAAANASTTFSTTNQNLTLGATVTSSAGVVNEATETFTLLSGATVIGTPVTVNVINGAASASYVVPGGTGGGAYVIQAVFNGDANLGGSSDNTHHLVVNAASTGTSTGNLSATFSVPSQNIALLASVTSPAGIVNEGTETFTILNGVTVVGTPLTVNVASGGAGGNYALPAGTPGGSYTIQAVYNPTPEFLGSTDSAHHLTIAAATSTTSATNASATFNGSGQSVALNATVNSPAGAVNEGTETFVVLNGALPVGSPVTVNVLGGSATGSYPLPAATPGGTYTIQATYNGTLEFLGSSDTTHHLTINAAATSTTSANALTTYNLSGQSVALVASISSVVGTVSEGTETFTLLNGNTVVGNSVVSNVVNGGASAIYVLPAGTAPGSYTIQAIYNGTGNFLGSSDNTHHLSVTAAATATVASNALATFNTASQAVGLNATVTSNAGAVNEGTETFTILSGATTIGSPVTVNVAGGLASATYTLPASTAAGPYTIQAVYTGTSNFAGASDSTHHLTVAATGTTTTAANASTAFRETNQPVALSAAVTSPAGIVSEGTETFTILNGTTVIGAPVTVSVTAGAANASYSVPASTVAGSYTIQAVYNGTNNYVGASESAHHLTISPASSTTAAANASTTYSQSVPKTVALSAAVTSPAGTVNEGTETFSILSGTTTIGNPVSVSVVTGAANANYVIPAGTPASSYTIQAVYNGTSNFVGSSDTTHSLTVNGAATATAASNFSATFSVASQSVALNATITSAGGTVSEGTETFTILNGATAVGNPISVSVANGAASASYLLPAGAAGGSYTIQAVYNGSPNFLGSSDNTHHLTINAAATGTTATNASTGFSASSQTVALQATVTSPAGTVNEGTETFTILNGATVIGTAVTVSVSSGSASASYTLPAALVDGSYTIQAAFNATADFLGSTDNSHSLTVSAAATVTTAANATATFSSATQTIPLSATVTSLGGTVSQGTETFTILNGSTAVGSPVTASVSAGAANTNYTLPAGSPGGSYIIQAVYNGTPAFSGSSDNTHHLVVSAAATTTVSTNASTVFNEAASQTVSLSATVTSAAGTVNEGTETFSVLSGATVVGTPVTVNVSAGATTANYAVPAATPAGSYTIRAVYNGTAEFVGSSDATHQLTIGGAATSTLASNASATYSTSGQPVILIAAVTSAAGTIGEGTETFTVLNGSTVIGSPVTVNVVNNAPSASFVLPASTPVGTYTIQAVYNGTSNFLGSSDNTHHLVVGAATTTTAAVNAFAPFLASSQVVALTASVMSAAGIVNEGAETFTILSGSSPVGSPVTVSVSAGTANANYTLPAGQAAGSYTIQAVYNATPNFLGSTDSIHHLTIGTPITTTTAANASTTFNTGIQSVGLSATVINAAGTVNEGTETFTVLNGVIVVGLPVTVNVSAGTANASYSLPAATPGGTYIIQATYNGTPNFPGATDSTHHLTVSPANTTTAASNASATFSSSAQTVALNATVASAAGTVNEGTETFSVMNGSTFIGSAVTVNVVAGSAIANYSLPAGTPGGTYTIQAVYNGTGNFLTASDNTHHLVDSAAATTTVAANTSAPFHSTSQTVALSATVSSSGGTVSEGTETFTILNGSTVIGTAVTVNVTNGAANAIYTLPAGTLGGSYTIQANYTGTANYANSSDSTHHLIVNAATTSTTASNASATFSSTSQSVALSATVTSVAGTVNEGTETFTVLSGSTVIGSAVTVNVAAGAANANYTLPAGAPGGNYIIQATFNGTPNFATASDNAHHLTISAATTSTSAANASTTFSASNQSVALSATITSAAGIVNEGTETFTILNGSTTIGTAVTVNVSAGAASASYTLPGGTPGGPYTIQAAYNGTTNFANSSDSSHHLNINAATTVTSAANAVAPVRAASQSVVLNATVTSPAGTINEGTLTFTILNGSATVGSPVTVNVAAGAAQANYTLPANTPSGSYTIQAVYNGAANFATSTDNTHHLVVKLKAVPADFDGDGKTDVAIFDQTTAQIQIQLSGGGTRTVSFGNPADINIPIAGDFDGDGKTDIAVYDQNTSTFEILLSGGGAIVQTLGTPGHVNIPIAGDFNGDGKTDLALYDQNTSSFQVLLSGGGTINQPFGNPAHVNIPLPGDFDGDGKTDLAIYDQTASQFFVLYSGGGAETPAFGNPADFNIPVAGDYDGDGKTDLGIYDQTGGQFFILFSGGGAQTPFFGNGSHANIPLGGDYNGDGKTDIGIYDQTSAEFLVLLSGGGAITPFLGTAGHVIIPLPSVYLPHRTFGRSVPLMPDRGFPAFDFGASATQLSANGARDAGTAITAPNRSIPSTVGVGPNRSLGQGPTTDETYVGHTAAEHQAHSPVRTRVKLPVRHVRAPRNA
jgi:hypothetical protein